jgi:hypothetical protein
MYITQYLYRYSLTSYPMYSKYNLVLCVQHVRQQSGYLCPGIRVDMIMYYGTNNKPVEIPYARYEY